MLIPFKLTNLADPYQGNPTTGNPGHNGQDTPIDLSSTPGGTDINGVAWIAANDPNNGGAPRMPELEASLAAPSGTTVWWKLKVIFHNRDGEPHRDFDTGDPNELNSSPSVCPDDTVNIPYTSGSGDDGVVNGWEPVPAGTPWDIYLDEDWLDELATGFFGGDAELSMKITTSDGNTTILPEQDFYFRIAGENPQPTAARAFITSQYGAQAVPTRGSNPNAWQGFWFAAAIAKEETVGVGSHHFYNQFTDNGGQGLTAVTGQTKFNIPAGAFNPAWNNPDIPLFTVAAQTNPLDSVSNQGHTQTSSDGTKHSSYASGRVGSDGQNVNYHVMGQDVPWIFSEIICQVASNHTVTSNIEMSVNTDWQDSGTVSGTVNFNNLNIYKAVFTPATGSLNYASQKLLPMEGQLQSFILSVPLGTWPTPPTTPSVQ